MESTSFSEYFYEPDGVEGHRCGYCGGSGTSVSNGMWTHKLTCEDYRDLIDRGWRRSGKYCYKPIMRRTCCPLYAVRCDATQFRLSRAQKKVLKRMNEFLVSGSRREAGEGKKHGEENTSSAAEGGSGDVDGTSVDVEGSRDPSQGACAKVVRPGVGRDPSKPACRKAKVVRRERRQQKETERGGESQGVGVGEASAGEAAVGRSGPSFLEIGPDGKKPLEQFLSCPASDTPPAHRLEVKLIRSAPPSRDFKSTFKESLSLYQKYQVAVHGDKEEDCSEKQFRRFLCDSPLIPRDGPPEWPCGYGSYHQHYYIDGRLVMVGVVDILPDCLSSVYVFYDPDYKFLSPGVYSALREIETTRKLCLHLPTFKNYCMGYYLHTCQKMRYKGQYSPSFLLCPETHQYVPIEGCRPRLDVSRYARLNQEEAEAEAVESWVSGTLVVFQRTAMPYGVLRSMVGGQNDAKVREYAALVGPKVASRMLLLLFDS